MHVGRVGGVPAGDQREGGQGRPQGVRIEKTVGFFVGKAFLCCKFAQIKKSVTYALCAIKSSPVTEHRLYLPNLAPNCKMRTFCAASNAK